MSSVGFVVARACGVFSFSGVRAGLAGAMRQRSALRVDGLSDHLRRDVGLVDGHAFAPASPRGPSGGRGGGRGGGAGWSD